jgi:ABC-type bacteriocin/lantibiotic exporter with double-glycine peptidase domain
MNTNQIKPILQKFAEVLKQEYNYYDLKEKFSDNIKYDEVLLGQFIDHLAETAPKISLTLLRNQLSAKQLSTMAETATFPILVFRQSSDGIHPIMIYPNKKGKIEAYDFQTNQSISGGFMPEFWETLLCDNNSPYPDNNGKIVFVTAFPMEYLGENSYEKQDVKGAKKEITPLSRLFRLLAAERREIYYLYVYAFIVGLITLTLPLGIQATVSLISGGMVSSSVVVLISLVIIGILLGGILQTIQVVLVETIQQRIFSKAAFELSYRVTKIKTEALQKSYPPELMNRFFDVVSIEKGMPKLFVDLTGAFIQIVFGLILLSIYHYFFLVFSFTVVSVVVVVIYLTSAKGLKNAIYASKYKYKIAFWLEELARVTHTFKQAGNTNLPVLKMDELINNYLYYRKKYFNVLVGQLIAMVGFKTFVTGGLLILGTILVINRSITLGQFVAAEVIIILVVASVEKLIVGMETVYDLLVSVDKVGHITDLPVERNYGMRLPLDEHKEGLHIVCRNLKYKYPDSNKYILNGIDLEIKQGQTVCIAGANDSGKHTLVKVILGFLSNYEGSVTLNGWSIHDLHLSSIRDAINKNLSLDEIFDGTILDNITLGRSNITAKDVNWAIEKIGLSEFIASLPDGLQTHIGATGKKLSGSITTKIALARSIASRPKLLVINDFSEHIQKTEKLKILSFLREKENGWTLIILSVDDDAFVFSSCDKIVLLNEGKIAVEGLYDDLLMNKEFQRLVFNNLS